MDDEGLQRRRNVVWRRQEVFIDPRFVSVDDLSNVVEGLRQNTKARKLYVSISTCHVSINAEAIDLVPLWNTILYNSAALKEVHFDGKDGTDEVSAMASQLLEAADGNNSSITSLSLKYVTVHANVLSTFLRITKSVNTLDLYVMFSEETLAPGQAARNLSESIAQNIEVLSCYNLESHYQAAILSGLTEQSRIREFTLKRARVNID